MARANPGDFVVMCVDQHAKVVAELENRTHVAHAGSHATDIASDPDLDPELLAQSAMVNGAEADAEAFSQEEPVSH